MLDGWSYRSFRPHQINQSTQNLWTPTKMSNNLGVSRNEIYLWKKSASVYIISVYRADKLSRKLKLARLSLHGDLDQASNTYVRARIDCIEGK